MEHKKNMFAVDSEGNIKALKYDENTENYVRNKANNPEQICKRDKLNEVTETITID